MDYKLKMLVEAEIAKQLQEFDFFNKAKRKIKGAYTEAKPLNSYLEAAENFVENAYSSLDRFKEIYNYYAQMDELDRDEFKTVAGELIRILERIPKDSPKLWELVFRINKFGHEFKSVFGKPAHPWGGDVMDDLFEFFMNPKLKRNDKVAELEQKIAGLLRKTNQLMRNLAGYDQIGGGRLRNSPNKNDNKPAFPGVKVIRPNG